MCSTSFLRLLLLVMMTPEWEALLEEIAELSQGHWKAKEK